MQSIISFIYKRSKVTGKFVLKSHPLDSNPIFYTISDRDSDSKTLSTVTALVYFISSLSNDTFSRIAHLTTVIASIAIMIRIIPITMIQFGFRSGSVIP